MYKRTREESGYIYDLLGEQLLLAYRFVNSGFDKSLEGYDVINNEECQMGAIFEKQNGKWYLGYDSLPGDMSIKAIAVDASAIYLETGLLDSERVINVLVDNMSPFGYDSENNCFMDLSKNEKIIDIIQSSDDDDYPGDLMQRSMWILPIMSDKVRMMAMLRLADEIYSSSAYEVESVSEAKVDKMSLKVNLEFQQKLGLEQRPILSLNQSLKVEQKLETRLEIKQIMAISMKLLRMNEAELIEFAAQDASKTGQKRTINIFLFALAGKFKPVLEKQRGYTITWKEARKYARRSIGMG